MKMGVGVRPSAGTGRLDASFIRLSDHQGLLPSPLSLFLLLSWNRPRGCKAKWSHSEEGHPLAWCSGQTLQQRFLCSTHLLVLAHSSGPQHGSGQALANMLIQQPDLFTQVFSVSTVGSHQMWEWNWNLGLWTVRRLKHCEKVIPMIFIFPLNLFLAIPWRTELLLLI